MRQLTFLLITILPLTIQSQSTTESKPAEKSKRISLGLIFSPDYSYRTLKSDGSMGANAAVSNRDKLEVAKMGYTAGLNVCFKITSIVALETGVQYSDKGYKTKMVDMIYAQPDPNAPTKTKYITGLSYLDIPSTVKISFGEKRLRFSGGAGLVVNILLKETMTSVMYFNNGNKMSRIDRTYKNYRKLNLSPVISAGFDYRLNNKRSIKVEPTFRYGILKTIEAPVSENIWNAGLNIGYYITLK